MSSFRLMFFGLLALGGLQLQAIAANPKRQGRRTPQTRQMMHKMMPDHMQFTYGESGVIEMMHKKELRLNVKGGDLTHGAPIVLWTEQAEDHEQFVEDQGFIKLKTNPSMCLNIEGGLAAGHNLVTWPCGRRASKRGPAANPNAEFKFGSQGRIHPKSDSNLCLNVKGADFQPGAEVVLWQCEGAGHDHEMFEQDGDRIAVMSHPELHFNVMGGDVSTPGAKVVLYTHQPSAHEVFEISRGRIHLKQHVELCLNAEGGLLAGHRIVLWPCNPVPAENELFYFDKNTGAIRSTRRPDLAFNAAGGGMNLGDEIVLWSTKQEEL